MSSFISVTLHNKTGSTFSRLVLLRRIEVSKINTAAFTLHRHLLRRNRLMLRVPDFAFK